MRPLKALAERVLKPELSRLDSSIRGRMTLMETTIADLQRELQGWRILSGGERQTFSRSDLATIYEQSRAACLRSAFAIRSLDIMSLYTFAQGWSIISKNMQDAVDDITTDRHNANQLFGHEGANYANRELCSTGNLFVMRARAEVPQFRVLPVEQFKEIVCDPDDAENVWFYLRERPKRTVFQAGTGQSEDVYHPDGGLDEQTVKLLKAEHGDKANGKTVMWDQPVSHYRIGGYHHWKWGLPPAYGALTWLAAHTRFISEWTTYVSAISRFSYKLSMKGATQDQITAAAALFTSNLVGNTTGDETNPPHTTASTWVSNDSVDMKPFQARGMAIDPSDGKQIALMAFACFGLPAHFFGDVDQGNLATATSLDRPTELLFRNHQNFWSEIFKTEVAAGLTAMRRTGAAGTKAEVDVRVDFPPILHHDPQQIMQALVMGLTLDGKALTPMFQGSEFELTREILATADIDSGTIEAVLAKVYDEKGKFRNPPTPMPEQLSQAMRTMKPERAALVGKLYELTRAVMERQAA